MTARLDAKAAGGPPLGSREDRMFRPMRRFKQQLTDEECVEILRTEGRGVLSLHGEDGYPYGVPIDFLYDDGKVYFHGAKEGHKMDALAADDRACLTVYDAGVPVEGKEGPDVRSVIVFGRISVVEDHAKAMEEIRKLGLKYVSPAYTEDILRRTESRVRALELTIDHMTGKLVNES
jgi:nitroimidazol reductase NimA-like FMN-containing flavoprotein (pyridoxamine 5'-phosphate oxidase superfamily)